MKFLFFPQSWILAHTSRCVEIAKALRDRGHTCVFAGAAVDHTKSNLRLARDEGFRVEAVEEPNLGYLLDRYNTFGALAGFLDSARPQRFAPVDRILVSQVRLIEREAPAMVVGAQTMTVSLAAHVTGVACAGILNSYLLSAVSANALARGYVRGYERAQFGRLRARALASLNHPNVDPLPIFQRMPLLCPDASEMFEEAPFFENVHPIGPIFFDHPAPLPEWMEELEDGTPNVYIAMGSTGRMDLFLRKAFRTLGKLPYRFIVTTGNLVMDATVQHAPANFRFTKFAPGSALLKHCRAMICHGGNGTMYQALASGVPMVAVPSHAEQEMNIRSAMKTGVLVRVRLWAGFAPRVARAVVRVVEQPDFREAAQRIQDTIQPGDSARNAAEILEAYASRGDRSGNTA